MQTLQLQTDVEVRVVVAALEQTRQDMAKVLMNSDLNCMQAASYEITHDTADVLVKRLAGAEPGMIRLSTREVPIDFKNGIRGTLSVSSRTIVPDIAGADLTVFGFDEGTLESLSLEGLIHYREQLAFSANYVAKLITQRQDAQQHEATRATWKQNPAPLQPVDQENAALARRGVSDLADAHPAGRH